MSELYLENLRKAVTTRATALNSAAAEAKWIIPVIPEWRLEELLALSDMKLSLTLDVMLEGGTDYMERYCKSNFKEVPLEVEPAASVEVVAQVVAPAESLKEVLDQVEATTKPAGFHKWSDLMKYRVSTDPDIMFTGKDIDEDGKIVTDAFLRKGDSVSFTAGTGEGKSVLMSRIIGCLAIGKSFIGLTPVRPMRVEYWQRENHFGDLAQAAQGAFEQVVKETASTDEEKAKLLQLLDENVFIASDRELPRPPRKLDYGQEEEDPQFALALEHIRAFKLDVMIIDPKGAFYYGASTDEEKQKRWLAGWKQVQVKTGVIVMFVEHNGHRGQAEAKDGKFSAYQQKGDTSAVNFYRAIAVLAKVQADPNFSRVVWTKREARLAQSEHFLKRVPGKVAWEAVEALPTDLVEVQADPKARREAKVKTNAVKREDDKAKREAAEFRAAAVELWHQLPDEPMAASDLCEDDGYIQNVWKVKRGKAFAILNKLVERSILKRNGKMYEKDELDPVF
jgi:hypothetical protein